MFETPLRSRPIYFPKPFATQVIINKSSSYKTVSVRRTAACSGSRATGNLHSVGKIYIASAFLG